ncbi:unnamed protein product [Amoebophrya sp. A25]|nr:unnamed protein product [Amoebophrya sp. A25]|eukprot:GSA25T00008326001.1
MYAKIAAQYGVGADLRPEEQTSQAASFGFNRIRAELNAVRTSMPKLSPEQEERLSYLQAAVGSHGQSRRFGGTNSRRKVPWHQRVNTGDTDGLSTSYSATEYGSLSSASAIGRSATLPNGWTPVDRPTASAAKMMLERPLTGPVDVQLPPSNSMDNQVQHPPRFTGSKLVSKASLAAMKTNENKLKSGHQIGGSSSSTASSSANFNNKQAAPPVASPGDSTGPLGASKDAPSVLVLSLPCEAAGGGAGGSTPQEDHNHIFQERPKSAQNSVVGSSKRGGTSIKHDQQFDERRATEQLLDAHLDSLFEQQNPLAAAAAASKQQNPGATATSSFYLPGRSDTVVSGTGRSKLVRFEKHTLHSAGSVPKVDFSAASSVASSRRRSNRGTGVSTRQRGKIANASSNEGNGAYPYSPPEEPQPVLFYEGQNFSSRASDEHAAENYGGGGGPPKTTLTSSTKRTSTSAPTRTTTQKSGTTKTSIQPGDSISQVLVIDENCAEHEPPVANNDLEELHIWERRVEAERKKRIAAEAELKRMEKLLQGQSRPRVRS